VTALVTGSVDFTTAGGSAMRAAVNGAPLKMVLNIAKKADLWIMTQKQIQRVEDLRGKMIGVGGNWGTQFYQVLEALKPSGVDKDVQLVSTGDVGNGYLTLQQGSLPAVALTPPYSMLAKRQGFRDVIKTSDVIGVAPTTGLVTTKERLEKEPQKVRRAIRAVFRAVEFAKTRKPETIQFIMRQYKMDKDVTESVYDAIMETLNPTLSLTDQEIQVELNRIAEQTKTKVTAKPADLADFTIARQVAQELGR
jgi:NitT/TauT family transport system substrate-binding protein